ncbi:MAG: class I SAM-dependent methyltransferase [Nitratireductor sp.]|nr:class I SAM-dependent methyltransferase [Nitratireductor sp.]
MNDTGWKTLFHPFERGLIAMPGEGGKWLYSGSVPGFVLPSDFEADLTCVQGFRPFFLALEKQGRHVLPELSAVETWSGALVQLGRFRDDNTRRCREAISALEPGSLVVIAGGRTEGVDPLRKRLRAAIPQLQHASKHHGVVLWFEVPENGGDDLLPRPADPVRHDGMTIPVGGFSADGPDPGSVMLAGYFGEKVKGAVADFGAGWGYLGVQVLRHCPQVGSLESFEADWRSLQAARENLATVAGSVPLAFHWQDLLTEGVERRFDTVVMNPPFHEGRAARPQIGIGFIDAASRALKPGGRLLMVANRNLPYEAMLETRFRRFDQLADADGYKVIEAIR